METSDDRVETRQVPERVLRPAFRLMFEAEFGYVCRALRRLGVHDGDLKDVAQELFVAVHDSSSTLRSLGRLRRLAARTAVAFFVRRPIRLERIAIRRRFVH
jgi:DNA-directed RNA polymerase specialized sigma24 family protein